MRATVSFLVLLVAFSFGPLHPTANAQVSSMDEVHLISGDTFFRDAPISPLPYFEGLAIYSDADIASAVVLELRGAIPIEETFEIGARGTFLSTDPEVGDGASGLVDVPVYGRLSVFSRPDTKVSVGGFFDLPVGDEELGGGEVDFGLFGAVRHYLSGNVDVGGTLGVDFLESGDDREASPVLSGSGIFRATSDLHVITQLFLMPELDFAQLSGGLDYQISKSAHLRGLLSLGLDDSASDFELQGGILFAVP